MSCGLDPAFISIGLILELLCFALVDVPEVSTIKAQEPVEDIRATPCSTSVGVDAGVVPVSALKLVNTHTRDVTRASHKLGLKNIQAYWIMGLTPQTKTCCNLFCAIMLPTDNKALSSET